MTDTNNDLTKKYQKKTPEEHILDNPDTYIGSIDNSEYCGNIISEIENSPDSKWRIEEKEKISNNQIRIIPGLYKLFDEGLVNCRDHCIRMKSQHEIDKTNKLVTYIDIGINEEEKLQ